MEISVIVGQDVGWVGVASGEPGSTKSRAGGTPALVPLAAATVCSSNLPRDSCTGVRRVQNSWFCSFKETQDSKPGPRATLESMIARLRVPVQCCLHVYSNAVCTSISYVGLWLLHSCPVLQRVCGGQGWEEGYI